MMQTSMNEKSIILDHEKLDAYHIAIECAGILDVCRKLQLLDEQKYVKGRELIVRIVSILTKMAQRNK